MPAKQKDEGLRTPSETLKLHQAVRVSGLPVCLERSLREEWRIIAVGGFMRRTLFALLVVFTLGCSDDPDPTPDNHTNNGGEDTGVTDDTGGDEEDMTPAASGATMRFDVDGDDFFDLPLPADARLLEDGTHGFTRWESLYESRIGEVWLEGADDLETGWGLTSAVFAWFDEPIDASGFPESYATSLNTESGYPAVFLMNVDPESPEQGELMPIECKYTETEGTYHPANQVACASPYGVLRERSTRYALVFTSDFKDADGESIRPASDLERLMAGEDVDGTSAGPYEQTAQYLEGLDIDVSSMVLFTTMDPTERILQVADFYESLEEPTLDETQPAEVIATFEDYVVIEAYYDLPLVQQGPLPYAAPPAGKLVVDESGQIVQQGTESVKVLITVPKMAMPEGGFPVVFYLHGSGGTATQLVNRGPRSSFNEVPPAGSGPAANIAPYGIAGFAADFALHDSRFPQSPDRTGLKLYNLLDNPRAMIDNFMVAANEVAMHSRLMANVTIDASLHPDLDAGDAEDGLIRFDADRFAAMGQSMGSMIGTPTMTIPNEIDAFVNAGSGGTLIEIAVTSKDPLDVAAALKAVLRLRDDEDLDRYDVILNTLQHKFDYMDPYVHARHMILEPHNGVEPRHLFHPSGLEDRYFSPDGRAGLTTAFGVPIVEPVEEAYAFDYMQWAGWTEPIEVPVSGNLVEGTVTGFARQYQPAYSEGGHYVIFDKAEARAQYACFVKSLNSDGPPTLFTVENSSVENCP